MRFHAFVKGHWKGMSTLAFAILIYCFWYFLYPHLMAWREQSQLFLWNEEYLLERLAVPGGLAQYIGEMLVQFFATPKSGALVYALLAVSLQLLTWSLIRRPRFYLLSFVPPLIACVLALNPHIPMTPLIAITLVLAFLAVRPKAQRTRAIYTTLMIPIGYWLAGPAILLMLLFSRWRWAVPQALLLAACVRGSGFVAPYPIQKIAYGIDYYWKDNYMSTDEEMRYDRWMRMGQWRKIVDYSRSHIPQQASSRNVVQMAMWNLHLISLQSLQSHLDPTKDVMQSTSGAFIMSDIYMQMGLINMAQRAAFEAMESIPNHNKSGRALRRLTETAVATGQAEVAQKYLAILGETITLRKWAKGMRPLAINAESATQSPFYKKLRGIYSKSEDFFFY